MKFIELSNSKFKAVVDDNDYNRVMALNLKWIVNYDKNGVPNQIRSSSIERIILGRFILNMPDTMHNKSKVVDHIYQDIFDNRKNFIRVVLASFSMANRGKMKSNTTGYKGVMRNGVGFIARVRKNNIIYNCGTYRTPEEAALAYNNKVKEIWKTDKIYLNKIGGIGAS